MSPALAGGLLSTALPGKSLQVFLVFKIHRFISTGLHVGGGGLVASLSDLLHHGLWPGRPSLSMDSPQEYWSGLLRLPPRNFPLQET